jgi:hypothetical protein
MCPRAASRQAVVSVTPQGIPVVMRESIARKATKTVNSAVAFSGNFTLTALVTGNCPNE